MKTIPLTQGQVALVDDADYDWLIQWKWCSQYNLFIKGYYAVRSDCSVRPRKRIYMHNLILGLLPGELGDHVSRTTLDNRRQNLRKCTRSQNGANSRTHNKYGYKGISYYYREGKYRAFIMHNGKHETIGRYNSPEEAAAAYDQAALLYFGEFALTNAMIRELPADPPIGASHTSIFGSAGFRYIGAR